MNKLLILSVLLFSMHSMAARVAVVDSGTDFSHKHLSANTLINADEIPGNYVDDDGNGLVDDVLGWNIANSNGKTFSTELLSFVNPKVYGLFDIIAKVQGGTATKEEQAFLKKNLSELPEPQRTYMRNDLNFFGQFAHGTHVSGTVVNQSPKAQIMAVRVFPDTPPEVHPDLEPLFVMEGSPVKRFIYKLLAGFANGMFKQAGAYIHSRQIDIANMSIGAPLGMIAKALLQVQGKKEPTREEIIAEAQILYAQYEVHGKEWMASAPNTLFVVAAGNDGENNDELPTFPANVESPNKISVAATLGYDSMAEFTNYGKTTVDIAAPGVAEISSVPHRDSVRMMAMSGTSMAAPFIAGVAASLKDMNPALTPVELKKLLMGTVDAKEWLKGKVIAGGTVNSRRALFAAKVMATRSLSVDKAIAMSYMRVPTAMGTTKTFSLLRKPVIAPELKELAAEFVF